MHICSILKSSAVEAPVRPLVLDGEASLVPDIGPALAAILFGRARLEGKEGARRVKLHQRRVADERAQVEKMLLVDFAFGGRIAAPCGDKGFGCAGGAHRDRFL